MTAVPMKLQSIPCCSLVNVHRGLLFICINLHIKTAVNKGYESTCFFSFTRNCSCCNYSANVVEDNWQSSKLPLQEFVAWAGMCTQYDQMPVLRSRELFSLNECSGQVPLTDQVTLRCCIVGCTWAKNVCCHKWWCIAGRWMGACACTKSEHARCALCIPPQNSLMNALSTLADQA